MSTITFAKTEPPAWLLAMWKEIDDKTFGKGFDCFAEDAICNLGVADWHGREAIRQNLRDFIDKGLHCPPRRGRIPRQPAAQGLPRQGPDDLRRPGHSVSPSDDDPLFLHGRPGPYKGKSLDRLGRPDRLLTLKWVARGRLFNAHPLPTTLSAATMLVGLERAIRSR
jgi:hypothetical protein